MVRVLTVIGHGVDLLPHFIKHYTEYVDEIWIVISVTEISPNIVNDVNNIIKNYTNIRIAEIIKSLGNKYEIVVGGFIDRIGNDNQFPEIHQNTSIWEQFPDAGYFRTPMSGACPSKVCVLKGKYPLQQGQHYDLIDWNINLAKLG